MSDAAVVYLRCNSTMDNTNGIDRAEGSKTNVYCAESCRFKEAFAFYGHKAYSGDSSICRAAFYEEVISMKGGGFVLQAEPGREES